ncbi:MAG: WD40/YVTN/BNR-like repeat-containing protein [Desulfuromonadales bacterium]
MDIQQFLPRFTSWVCRSAQSLPKTIQLKVGAISLIYMFAGVFAVAESDAADASLQTPAMQSPLASKALLTGSAKAGERMVAVGAYGNIVYSVPAADGKGLEWRQANVPTQRLLTSVTFVDDREGWAGGHDTLILHTTDGGENWQIQHEDPRPNGDLPKPVLDIEFTDKLHGIAVGAFSLMLATADGGKTWVPVDTGVLYDRLDAQGQEPEPNLYSIIKLHDGFLIAGELGTLLHYSPRTENTAEQWRIIKSPYEGSFFGIRQLSSGDIFVYGLRGHMFRSIDQGETWDAINTGTTANINDVIEVSESILIGVGDGGTVLRLQRQQNMVMAEKIPYPGFGNLMSVQPFGKDLAILFGAIGAKEFPIK